MTGKMYVVIHNWYEDSQHGADDLVSDAMTFEEAEEEVRKLNQPGVRYAYYQEASTD